MTSVSSVLFPNAMSTALYDSVRTDSKLCTNYERLGNIGDVEITAEDVVRRYLWELLRARFSTKTGLATAMGTSRAQLQASIRQGRITVDQMNGLATTLGSSIYGVLRELSGIAEQMERGKLPKMSDQELAKMIGGQGTREEEEKDDEGPELPGEADRAELSGVARVKAVSARSGGKRAPSAPPRHTRPPAERNQKRSR